MVRAPGSKRAITASRKIAQGKIAARRGDSFEVWSDAGKLMGRDPSLWHYDTSSGRVLSTGFADL